jgi:hypothetical protein
MLGAALLILGQAAGAILLLSNAPTFAHASADRMSRLIRDPADVTVLFDEQSDWWYAYFPLTYRFGRELRQCLASKTPDGQLSLHLLPYRTPLASLDGIRGRNIALVTGKTMDTAELAVCIRNTHCEPLPESPVAAMLESGGWRAERTLDLPAFGRLRVTWFERIVSP